MTTTIEDDGLRAIREAVDARWPTDKKALFTAICNEQLNAPERGYINAWELCDRLYAAIRSSPAVDGVGEPVAWEVTDDDANPDASLTRKASVAEIWRKAGFTVRPLYARSALSPTSDRASVVEAAAWMIDYSDRSCALVFTRDEADEIVAETDKDAKVTPLYAAISTRSS